MNVRPADFADIPAMVELGRLMHAESPRYSARSYVPKKVEALLDRLIGSASVGGVFVIERDGDIVGMMGGYLIEHFFGRDKYVADFALYVLPEHRGSSAAVRLVQAFETWAREQGAIDACVGVSTEVDSDRTVGLYQRLGYRLYGYSLTKELHQCVTHRR